MIVSTNSAAMDDQGLSSECNIKDCSCSDCIIYFNPNTIRPIRGKNITDETFTKLIELCKTDSVINIMKEERFKSILYEVVPYNLWKSLEDPVKYQNFMTKLKATNKIPDENPEICSIELGQEIGLDDICKEIQSISYRFPTSTVKYSLTVYRDGDKIKLKTHSRGSEY